LFIIFFSEARSPRRCTVLSSSHHRTVKVLCDLIMLFWVCRKFWQTFYTKIRNFRSTHRFSESEIASTPGWTFIKSLHYGYAMLQFNDAVWVGRNSRILCKTPIRGVLYKKSRFSTNILLSLGNDKDMTIVTTKDEQEPVRDLAQVHEFINTLAVK